MTIKTSHQAGHFNPPSVKRACGGGSFWFERTGMQA